MTRSITLLTLPMVGLLVGLALGRSQTNDGPQILEVGAFSVVQEVLIDATPEQVFDAFTGDVSPWWDHTFSEQPVRLFLEPRPGGGFIELFDDEGNGVLHATVNMVKRPEELQFHGPLGFAATGRNLQMAHRVQFTAEGDRTRVKVAVHAMGEMDPAWPAAVQRVWHHFLVERLKPHVEGL
ncbi:MAG: SRPBCC domain-containing protein [Planctomycetota bacterium]